MPRTVVIGAVDSLKNPDAHLVERADRVVTFTDGDAPRFWNRARVIRPAKGKVLVDREDGVAIIASRGGSDDDIVAAVRSVPDPIAIFIGDKTPGSDVVELLNERCRNPVYLNPGAVWRVRAKNDPGDFIFEVEGLVLHTARRQESKAKGSKREPKVVEPKVEAPKE